MTNNYISDTVPRIYTDVDAMIMIILIADDDDAYALAGIAAVNNGY